MRRILHIDCKPRQLLDPEDVARGFHARSKTIRVKKPEPLVVAVVSGGKREEIALDTVRCDACGGKVHDGDEALAITVWRGDAEPGPWEKEYQ